MLGQSVWSGCGLDPMLWFLTSLLTNRTRSPSAMSTDFGETPVAVMVNVAAGVGAEGAPGADDLQALDSAAASVQRQAARANRVQDCVLDTAGHLIRTWSQVLGPSNRGFW